jgi:site-specific recombinase XerD
VKSHHSQSLGKLLESFFSERLVVQRRASPATVATYRDALKLLLVFASKRIGRPPSRLTLADLDRPMVLEFLHHLEKTRRNSIRTRNARLTAIRSFFQHVAYQDPTSLGVVQRILSIPGKRTVHRMLNHLDRVELRALIATPDRRTWLGRRDHALLLFLSETGARVTEAIGVDAADLRLERLSQVLLRGKGSKERVVPLTEATARVLKQLRVERGVGPNDRAPLFGTRRGARLSRFGIIHLMRRAVTGVHRRHPGLIKQPISPHTLRHTAAMNLLQSGVDLTTIRSWLGHVSVDTTHHYLEADVEMKRRALERCAPSRVKARRYRPPDRVLALLDGL